MFYDKISFYSLFFFLNFGSVQFSDTLTAGPVRQRISISDGCMTWRIRNIRICKLSADRQAPGFYYDTEISLLKGKKVIFLRLDYKILPVTLFLPHQ